jgi:hypothetical protein
LNDAEVVVGALERLEIENWARAVRGPTSSGSGRPTVRYELHPDLRRLKP